MGSVTCARLQQSGPLVLVLFEGLSIEPTAMTQRRNGRRGARWGWGRATRAGIEPATSPSQVRCLKHSEAPLPNLFVDPHCQIKLGCNNDDMASLVVYGLRLLVTLHALCLVTLPSV